MIELLLNAALWFPAAIAVGAAAVLATVWRERRRATPRRVVRLTALHVLHGCVMGMMGSGHLVAVTIRAFQGTLAEGLTWNLYPIGLVLAVPGWLLVAIAPRLAGRPESTRRILFVLDAWLIVALVAMGPSATLAIPAVLNLIALKSSRPAVETTVVALTALLYSALFVAALVLGGGDF